jgi:chromosome segregation ATPase
MSKAALKVAPVVDPTSEAREELRATFARIEQMKAALALNGRDQEAAREQIRALESELDEAEKALAVSSALARRTAQKKADEIRERLEDHRAHLLELQMAAGWYPNCIEPKSNSLERRLKFSETEIWNCGRQILRASPAVARLADRLQAMRVEMLNLEATVQLIWATGGLAPRAEAGCAPSDTFWAGPPHRFLPTPDPRWVEALERLKIDPDTVLPE